MSDNALRRKPPSGVLHRFFPDREAPHAGSIDLKHNAGALYVDAARELGLASGAIASGTVTRLRLAAACRLLAPEEAADWEGCFLYICLLRLRIQQQCYLDGRPMHNHVRPDQLDAQEPRLLLHSLQQQAGSMQQRLSQLFLASKTGL